MWRNVGDLFVQNQDADQNSVSPPPAPAVRYKTVDFANLNLRSIVNIPKPQQFPLYGPSIDPEFYREPYRVDRHGYKDLTLPSHYHNCGGRHGSMYGYQTDWGIVPVPDRPVHGHIWSHEMHNWVYHAVPPDESYDSRTPWTRRRPRSSTTRPPSARRRWMSWSLGPREKRQRYSMTKTAAAAMIIMSTTLPCSLCYHMYLVNTRYPNLHHDLDYYR